MKTTDERPLLPREGCQNVAYLQLAGCRLIWPLAIRSTPLFIASRSGKSTLLDVPSRLRQDSLAPAVEPGPQSLPKRAHPARQAHQPLGPGAANRPQAASAGDGSHPGGVDAGFPAVPAPRRVPASPVGRQPSRPPALQGGRPAQLAAGVLESARLMLSQSQRPTHRLNRHSHLTVPRPPSQQPPGQTPLSGSHLVGAHPPCSRKGPLLPACGPKSPWRVKREATNSRFCGLRDLAKSPCGLSALLAAKSETVRPLVHVPPVRY